MKLITQGKRAKEELMIIEPINIMQWLQIIQIVVCATKIMVEIAERVIDRENAKRLSINKLR